MAANLDLPLRGLVDPGRVHFVEIVPGDQVLGQILLLLDLSRARDRIPTVVLVVGWTFLIVHVLMVHWLLLLHLRQPGSWLSCDSTAVDFICSVLLGSSEVWKLVQLQRGHE